jgi:tetratricopeptide (TPR) repeat protein
MSRKLRTRIAALVFVALSAVTAQLPANTGNGNAGQPGEFLYYGPSVRSLALGRAYVGLADDASSIFYNPAGLMRMSRRLDVYLMHSDPLHASRYNVLSVGFSRLKDVHGWLGDLFIGPDAAIGLGAILSRADGFEHRTRDDLYLEESFGIYQQAYFLALAHRFSGKLGVLDLGGSMKLIRQGIDGLDQFEPHSGFGVDFGIQMQMIHPWPLTRLLSDIPVVHPGRLKNLLPLRLGLSLQNAFRPKVGLGNESESYPRVLRTGLSYQRQLRQDVDLLLVGDYNKYLSDQKTSEWHFGAEFQLQSDFGIFAPRFGIFHKSDEWTGTIGAGFQHTLAGFRVRVDFAHGLHRELHDDQMYSLTLTWCGPRKAEYFYNRGVNSLKSGTTDVPKATDDLLQVVSLYPNSYIDSAAFLLAMKFDTANAGRYFRLIGNIPYAGWLLKGAKQAQKEGDSARSRSRANEAVKEYANVEDALFEDTDRLGFAEAYMLSGIGTYPEKWDSASVVLQRVGDKASLPYHFLSGVCHRNLSNWGDAIIQFQEAVRIAADSASMRRLSMINLAQSMVNKYEGQEDVDRAALGDLIDSLNVLTSRYRAPLNEDYPRYPAFSDGDLADDAQYLIGLCLETIGDKDQALREYAKVGLFYPGSDSIESAERRVRKLLHEEH